MVRTAISRHRAARVRALFWCAGAAVLTGLALGGCAKPAGHDVTATPSATSLEGAMSSKEATSKIMAMTDAATAVASGKGSIDAAGSRSSAVDADILQVTRLADSTVLTWRLKSATGGAVATNSFQLSKPPFLDTRYVGLIDASTKKTYYAYTYVPANQADGQNVSCVCSGIPDKVDGNGTVLHSVLPPLPSSLKNVDVTIPGFDAITGVKVTDG